MSKGKLKVIFIGGSSRSGSTLLDRMLGQIEGFFSLGEMYHIWGRSFIENQLCGCGKPFRECEFWNAVVREAFGGFEKIDAHRVLRLQHSVARTRHVPYLAFPRLRSREFDSALREYVEILDCLYKAIVKVSGSNVLIDSSKTPPHGFVLREIQDIELYVIHLVRDSRAVAYSLQRKKQKPDIYWKTAYMPRKGFLRSTHGWLLANLLTQFLGTMVPRYIIVNYEDLAESPRETITILLEHLDLQAVNLNFFVNERRIKLGLAHTVAGNPIRFMKGEVKIYPDKEWERNMSFYKRCAISAITYPLLKRYQTLRLNRNKRSRRNAH